MSTPIPFRQMFALLAGVDDATPVKQIALYRAGETGPKPTVRIDAADRASALRWRDMLGLNDRPEFGQPHPLNAAAPDVWMATVVGDLSGWAVQVHHDEAYTDEHEARWVAQDGPRHHPRDEPAGGGSDA